MAERPTNLPARSGCCTDRLYREQQAAKGRDVSDFPKGCDDTTCMELPDGQTCGTCVHRVRCTSIFGAKVENTHCQFFPRRFHLAETTP